jgi:cyclophilin family peptidyl-prolyl cis-trans isomerase
VAGGGEPAPCPPAEGAPDKRTAFPAPPPMCIDKTAAYSATVETDAGSFVIDFDAAKAPVTVNNFVYLARYRAYEGVPFHRVIPDFVVQGGDVEAGTGTGGPGYAIPDELPKEGEYKVGSVAMANSGPDTNGSQFFVVTGPQGASLPAKYSLFGMVNKGMDVVKAIEKDGTAAGTPAVVHKITKVTITEKKG